MIKRINQLSHSKYSIVIPNHNSQKTIKKCLDAILLLHEKERFEVIVCDNMSSDLSLEIIKKYPFNLVINEKIQSAGATRNIGALNAKNDYIIFVDSDVCVPPNLIKLLEVNENFELSDCVTGVFSINNPYKNFFSQYKTLYANFKFKNSDKGVLNSGIMAIKKKVFFDLGCFDESLQHSEDDDFSLKFKKKGYRLYLNKNLVVDHLKNFTFFSLLKNDFAKSTQLTKIFLKSLANSIISSMEGNFFKLYFNYIFNIILLISIFILLILNLFINSSIFTYLFIFLVIVYFFNNYNFFLFCIRLKGIVFTFKSIFFHMIDLFTVSLAVLKGCLEYMFYKNKKLK
jgi:glycosyltransferase involved in cell wall biosynthesis